jgi:hypothetical protein
MKAPPGAPYPNVELEYFYAQLAVYAAEWVRSRSRNKREPSGILKDLAPPSPVEGIPVQYVRKSPRGGQPVRSGRFFGDPNLVAAAIAAQCISDWRGTEDSEKRHGPYKVLCLDGSMRNTRDAAARFAVALINKHYTPLLPPSRRREAELTKVLALLNRNRGEWPG